MRRAPALLTGSIVVAFAVGVAILPVTGRNEEAGAPAAAEIPRAAAPPAAPPGAILVPGLERIDDAVLARDTWYLLEGSDRRVHVLERDGRASSFPVGGGTAPPRPPDRPRRPRVLLAHHDTLVVFDRHGGAFRLHVVDGAPLGTRQIEAPGCPSPGVFEAASLPAGIVVLAVCPGRRLNTRAFALLERPGASWRVLAATAARPRAADPVDPFFTPVLAEHADGIAFGSAVDECLLVVAPDGAPRDSLCHRWLPRRPVPPGETRTLARVRLAARALGARIATPRTLPPFDGIFAAGSGRFAYRVRPAGNGRARRLVLGPPDEGRNTTLPLAARVFVAPGEALLGWRSGRGFRVAPYPLEN